MYPIIILIDTGPYFQIPWHFTLYVLCVISAMSTLFSDPHIFVLILAGFHLRAPHIKTLTVKVNINPLHYWTLLGYTFRFTSLHFFSLFDWMHTFPPSHHWCPGSHIQLFYALPRYIFGSTLVIGIHTILTSFLFPSPYHFSSFLEIICFLFLLCHFCFFTFLPLLPPSSPCLLFFSPLHLTVRNLFLSCDLCRSLHSFTLGCVICLVYTEAW